MATAEMLEVLGNEYNPEILQAASEPCSAQALSETLDVPIATCYRRIEELTEAELLELHDRPLSDDHRRINVYRRSVDEIHVEFEDTDVSVTVRPRADIKDTLDDVWRAMSEG